MVAKVYVALGKNMNLQSHQIWTDIKNLLHLHDCVIVPGFGGFVCNREPARIDQVSHLITPPSRKVVFNQNLKSNDGLLAGYIAQQRQQTYPQALSMVEETVEQVLAVLHEKKSLDIDLFGNFRLNAEANYVFLPDKRNNYLTSSYGLAMVQAHPVASRAVRSNKARLFMDRPKAQPERVKRNVWPGVLVGVLALLLSVNAYIFLNNHSFSDLRIASENTMNVGSWFDSLFSKQNETKVETPVPVVAPAPKPEIVEVIPAPPVADIPQDSVPTTVELGLETYAHLYAFAHHYGEARAAVYVPNPNATETETPTIQPEVSTETATIPEHLNTEGIARGYYVIGGVFCKERNANRFYKELASTGFVDAEMLINPDIKCKRVAYKRCNNRAEAELLCNDIKASGNPSAWILAAE